MALGSGWGVNEKVQNTEEPMPNFFSGSDLDFFYAGFFFAAGEPGMPYAVSGPVTQSSTNVNLNRLSTYNVKNWNMPDPYT